MEGCKEKEKLMDFVSNNLSASEAQVLSVHLQDCQQCVQEKEAIEEIRNALSSLMDGFLQAIFSATTLGFQFKGDIVKNGLIAAFSASTAKQSQKTWFLCIQNKYR